MKSLQSPAAVYALFLAASLSFSACKGSSSDTTLPQNSQQTTQPTSAVVKLSTAGTLPAGKKIGAIDVILTLAPGVTLKSTTNPPATDDGVVTASGVATNSLIVGNYTAPTSTLPGNVRIVVINAFGFGTGEFATVNGDIAAGSTPRASEFGITDLAVTDSEPSPGPISGLASGLSIDFR